MLAASQLPPILFLRDLIDDRSILSELMKRPREQMLVEHMRQ